MIAFAARRQILDRVIRPTLHYIGLHSLAAEQIVTITAEHESAGFEYLAQVNGPALSWWQIEPDTYHDLIKSTLPGLARSRPAIFSAYVTLVNCGLPREIAAGADLLAINPALACATARLLYWRAPAPLPAAFDYVGQAQYWKQFYNTPGGAGTVADYGRAATICARLWEARA